MNISPESKIEFKYRITVYAYIPIIRVWSLYMIKKKDLKKRRKRENQLYENFNNLPVDRK